MLVGPGQEKHCAWPEFANPLYNVFLNSALPDSASYYWVSHFDIDPFMSIEVAGTFVDARFMSLNVYDATGSSFERNGIVSGLADYQILPQEVDANPWQSSAQPGAKYVINVVPNPTQFGAELPYPELEEGAPVGTYPEPCTDQCPPTNYFFRGARGVGLLGEVNNAYLSALIQPQDGQVLVIRGRAPVSKMNRLAQPWPAQEQVRYWSLCNYIYESPYPLVINADINGLFNGQLLKPSCAKDIDIPLDGVQHYTIVVGKSSDKPQSLPDDVVWLSHSELFPNQRHILLLRNQLPNNFPQAIQNVPQDFNPLSAFSVMGLYYPRIHPCDAETFTNLGWQACIQQ
ncbi:MAG: hypothetical protein CMK89_05835 [Pseudomonadales bacterium]|nr:hypothetical protein [Pseudomonadales bacterium]